MDLSHDSAINDLIKDVIDHGCAIVEHRLILRWFGRKNWGRGMWQNLLQRFTKELTERGEERGGLKLYAIITNGHKLSLLCINPADMKIDDGWWRSVEKLA